jgi:predicted Zn-dependent protease with MMP-like domain
MEITRKEFEDLVIDILAALPNRFKDRLENIDFVIEEGLRNTDSAKMTLGLYEGIPYNRRGRGIRTMPDKITIYKKAIEKISRNRQEMKKNLKRVIHHEIGHYFGFNEKKLRELGY